MAESALGWVSSSKIPVPISDFGDEIRPHANPLIGKGRVGRNHFKKRSLRGTEDDTQIGRNRTRKTEPAGHFGGSFWTDLFIELDGGNISRPFNGAAKCHPTFVLPVIVVRLIELFDGVGIFVANRLIEQKRCRGES